MQIFKKSILLLDQYNNYATFDLEINETKNFKIKMSVVSKILMKRRNQVYAWESLRTNDEGRTG